MTACGLTACCRRNLTIGLPSASAVEGTTALRKGVTISTSEWNSGHGKWDALLASLTDGTGPGSGISADMIGKVLMRAALAPEPASRSEISKGSMLERPRVLASGAVGKAVDALIQHGLLQQEGLVRKGQVGAPSMPLRLGSPRWVIAGIHVDQQHEGPDTLTGIMCGLDRQPFVPPVVVEIPKEDGKHDLRGLVQNIRELTETLVAQAAGQPRSSAEHDLLGVGVELGGHLHRGMMIDSTHARWSQPVHLGAALTEEFSAAPQLTGVPVIVENDVNALAIHSYYERRLKGPSAALVVVFRKGVGGALILDGRPYRGSSGMAPEPGHLAVDYPKDPDGSRPPPGEASEGRTFDDECMCSTKDHKMYGHVDTLATPSRIEGHLAALKPDERTITLEQAAAAPRALLMEDRFVLTEEAQVLRRAGRALGRGLAHIVNIVNPGQLVLLLPSPLARPAHQSSGTEYLDAAEFELDSAYSTGPADARGGGIRLTVHSYGDDELARDGAVAAATTAFSAFIEHARGVDGCALLMHTSRARPRPRQLST